jgi:hypothetical protein
VRHFRHQRAGLSFTEDEKEHGSWLLASSS